MERRHFRLLILGSGPAGYSAAIYAARANLKPALVTGIAHGGQLISTSAIDNWPADFDGVQGPELMDRFQQHAARFDTEFVYDHINTAHLGRRPFVLEGDDGVYTCDTLIIATGASAKFIGLPAEQAFIGRGVSTCSTCDAYTFKDQDVIVVGGGNTAVEEVLHLANICRSTTLVHRRKTLRAEKILVDRLMHRVDEGLIVLELDTVVEDLVGGPNGLESVQVRNVLTGAARNLSTNGLFVAIGHTPNTSLFDGQVDMENGYIVTVGGRSGNSTATSVPGVFAAGDVQDQVYRQAVTSAATGCMAALDAEKYLSGLTN